MYLHVSGPFGQRCVMCSNSTLLFLPQTMSTTTGGRARRSAGGNCHFKVAMGSNIRVAVIGSGISGAVCASMLAGRGVSVTVFESGRGAGGRMAQRRETSEDGKELYFDHGAPFFTVSNEEVMEVVKSWETRGLVREWNERFGSFDGTCSKFIDIEKVGSPKRYVGIPGMNSICKALCHQPELDARFGVTVGKIEWLALRNQWLLTSLDGLSLGNFDGVVASDKNVSSPRFTRLTGKPPPLDTVTSPELAQKLQHIPVLPCFAVMLAFSEPLSSIPVRGFSFKTSNVLSWAFCDTSKPGRSTISSTSGENWVLHSTTEYASGKIAKIGPQKPSDSALAEVAEDLFREFSTTTINIPRPFFLKAHRWGSAFPAVCIGGEDMCLWDKDKKLAICGDFCAGASVEGAVLSGIRAASKFLESMSCL